MFRKFYAPELGGFEILLVLAICLTGVALTYGVDFLVKYVKRNRKKKLMLPNRSKPLRYLK